MKLSEWLDEKEAEGYTLITMPYEFLPLPEKGTKGIALDRSGKEVCTAVVENIKTVAAYDHTNLLTIQVPNEMGMKARFFKWKQEVV